MGLEYDRKQLAAKQKKRDEYKSKAHALRGQEAAKLGDVAKARAAADKFAKDAQGWEKKAASLESEMKRLQDRVTKG